MLRGNYGWRRTATGREPEMTRCTTSCIVVLALAVALWASALWAADFVVVCPVTGMVDDGLGVLIERAVKESNGARALILEVDTPGGLVDSAIEISKSLSAAPCRTIAYIHGMGAISAGALISYACKDMIMAPDTNIGAATPVVPSAEGMAPTGEKEVSFMRAKMRALAERNGHNPAIGEAMVDKDIELRAYTDEHGKLQVFAVYNSPVEGTSTTDMVRRVVDALPPELEEVRKLAKEVLPSSTENAPETPPPPTTIPVATVAPDPSLGEVILPAGKLLTLTPQEAIKYGVIPATAGNLEEVLKHYGLTDVEVRRLQMTWAEAAFRWLTNPVIAGILLMLGIGGIYLEIKTPGFGIPGVIGIVCLAMFFGAHVVLGVADWIDVLLVVIGLALIITEIFILPGHLIFGVTGILCVLVGLYMSLTTVTVPRYSWDYDRLRGALVSMTVAMASLTAFVYAVWKLFPHTPFHSALVQTLEQKPEQGYVVQTAEQQDAAIGLKGVAISMLRPAGRGRFAGKTFQVVSRGEFIEDGTPIVIIQADGNRYVVAKAEKEA